MSGALVTRVFESALSRTLKPLAAVLASFANDDGTACRPSVARLAWMLDVHDRHIRRGLAVLRLRGILTVTLAPAPNRPTRYQFHADALPTRPAFVARQLGLDFSTVSTGVHRTSGANRRACTSADPSDRSVTGTRTQSSSRREPLTGPAGPTPRPLRTAIATDRMLVKLAHLALNENPALVDDETALADAVKWKLARWSLAITDRGDGASARLYRAVTSAIYQRRYVGRRRA